MSKLTVGGKLPDFTYDTPFASGVSIADTARKVGGKTALVFLRYYGCTLCQYDIHEFAIQHDKIADTGGQMLVVLQSDPAKLSAQLKPGDLPFNIVCDPDQKLYKRFEIAAAPSKEAMIDAKAVGKIAKAKAKGFKHGDYEGEELQLPAAFVVEPDLTLTYAHYGKSVGDVPDSTDLAELLK
ncbi:MAG: AhpC/TSA family protein [Oscillospiraceae bacterium]|uniref:peroxiredoxin-like family protein n=1 Tax=Intestinimonas sp. UBA1698 TaxID=1946651 RepID=UPI001D5AAC1C|nr:peroxiredoxin-like family protein [Intestinimonas sp. UBA1698]MBS6282653.1 AhpC/TSA family protein [Oscillospiraceae bacterium]